MAHQHNSLNNEKQEVTSTQSMFAPNSLSPARAKAPAPPPPYAFTYQAPRPFWLLYPQYYAHPTPDMGCQQPSAPPPDCQPYYHQPTVVYSDPPVAKCLDAYPQQQQQQQQLQQLQQQQQGVLTPAIVDRKPPVSMVGAIVLSCIVYFCCGWVCGGIALIFAMIGQSSAAAGNRRVAIQLRNTSYGLSIVGIVTTIVVASICLVIIFSTGDWFDVLLFWGMSVYNETLHTDYP